MAAATFETAIAYVLAHEGVYVNNPRDPGGPTKPVTTADVRALGRAETEAIYRAEYWDRARCDAPPAGLDYVVMDLAVNSGVGRAARFLQTLLKARGLYAGDIECWAGLESGMPLDRPRGCFAPPFRYTCPCIQSKLLTPIGHSSVPEQSSAQ